MAKASWPEVKITATKYSKWEDVVINTIEYQFASE